MLLLLLIYVVLRALWEKDVYLISTLVNKSLYYYYYYLLLIYYYYYTLTQGILNVNVSPLKESQSPYICLLVHNRVT